MTTTLSTNATRVKQSLGQSLNRKPEELEADIVLTIFDDKEHSLGPRFTFSKSAF